MNDSNIKSSLCMFCGKKGRGTCASLGQTICAYCCGTKRNEAINCSKDCEHNPLSIKGYDNYLRIDKGLIVKMLDYVLASIGKEKFEKIMGKMTFSDEGGNASITDAAAGAMNYMLFVERDARGMTLAQKWESENWNGLTNDEKTLIKYNMNSSLTVIEVQKILDNQTMECIDMLGDENKKFIVLDHNMAPHFTRFARMFVWIAHYPNFSRALNNGIELTSFVEREFMEDLYIGYRKARDKNEWLTVRQYLAKNYGKLVQNIFDINREKAKRILQKMDVHQC